MGIAHVVVRRLLSLEPWFCRYVRNFSSPDRMVTFFVALLCFCFVISNPWTRVIVGLTSALVVALTVLSLRTAWGSRNAFQVWVDGFLPYLVGPLQRIRGSVGRLVPFVPGVVQSLRNFLTSRVQGDAGNV